LETIKFSCQEENLRAQLPGFVIPGAFYQFFDLTHRVVVNDTGLQLLSSCEQKPIGKKPRYLQENHMKPNWRTSIFEEFDKLNSSGKNVRLSSPHSSKNLLDHDLNTLAQKQ